MRSALDIGDLIIMRGSLEAGTLRRTTHGCSFEFNQSFLKDASYPGLSLCMPKSEQPYTMHGTNLHPFFAGLLPEGLRLRVLRERVKTSPDDLFSLFAAIGEHVIGDVYVKSTMTASLETVCPRLDEIDFFEYFLHLVGSDSYSNGEDAIAGVQEKISASMINLPLRLANSRGAYILKLNPSDKPSLVENEFWCLQLAAKCRLAVSATELVQDKNDNKGLLVRRFDRTWDPKECQVLMHHQEDACQFLNRYPADKYRISLNDIGSALKLFTSAPKVATLKMLQHYCFSYLLGNGDQHAKNISVRSHGPGTLLELAPAYDLICT